MDWSKLQREHLEWHNSTFGKAPPWMPLLGIVEELGELKNAQDSSNGPGIVDAIGDTMIFLIGYCSHLGIPIEFVVKSRWNGDALQTIAGKLCHYHLKTSQGLMTNVSAEQLLGQLVAALRSELSSTESFSLETVVEHVWSKVRTRTYEDKRCASSGH